MYSVCSFWYMLMSSLCAFLCFWVLALLGFLLFKRNNIKNLSFTTPQTLLDKHLCDWSRAIVCNQSEHTRHMTLGSVLGYKYKHNHSLPYVADHPSKTLTHQRFIRTDEHVMSTTQKQQTLDNPSDKISLQVYYFATY